MPVQDLVNRLDHCKPSGKDSYIARCPAHEDSSPSLTIKELPDGRVLVHCFAGCGAIDVLEAVGLDWSTLFPPDGHYRSIMKKPQSETVDSLVIEIVEHDRGAGKRLSKADIERYRQALKRTTTRSNAIQEILREAAGR